MGRLLMKTHKGFTIIELMITIGILAILVALAAPSFTESIAKKRADDCMGLNMENLRNARAQSFGGSTNPVSVSSINCASDVTISVSPSSFPVSFAYKSGRSGVVSGNTFTANTNRISYTFGNNSVPNYEKKFSISLSGKVTRIN